MLIWLFMQRDICCGFVLNLEEHCLCFLKGEVSLVGGALGSFVFECQ